MREKAGWIQFEIAPVLETEHLSLVRWLRFGFVWVRFGFVFFKKPNVYAENLGSFRKFPALDPAPTFAKLFPLRASGVASRLCLDRSETRKSETQDPECANLDSP